MTLYYFVKEYIPTGERWIRLVKAPDDITFFQRLNTWNESSMDWKYWRAYPTMTFRGVDICTMKVDTERPLK